MGWHPLVMSPARKLMIERGVTAKQIASDMGLSHGVLAKIVNGSYRPNARYADALAEYLGVAVAELFPPDGES
jgi:transcriptional regulator with XRE-family HTH domain